MKATGIFRSLGLCAAAAALGACGGATLLVNGGPPKLDGPLRAIATTTNRPSFSDQLAARLNAMGYSALDANASAAVTGSALGQPVSAGTINLVTDPDVLARMRALQVDVVMAVEVRMVTAHVGFSGTTELLDGVKVTLYSMSSPGPAGGFDWTNAWGGMPGSPADSLNRLAEPAAADRLAGTIAKLVGPPGQRVTIDAGVAAAAQPFPRRRKKRKAALAADAGAVPDAAAAPAAAAAAGAATASADAAAPGAPPAAAEPAAVPAAAEPPRPLSATEVRTVDSRLMP